MYSAAGLEAWEIVVASGLCAMGFLAISSVIGVSLALFLTRTPRPVTAPATARPAAPVAVYPAYASGAPTAVAG